MNENDYRHIYRVEMRVWAVSVLYWKENITINEEEFKHIQDIMKASNELDNYVEYDKLIFNEFFKDYE